MSSFFVTGIGTDVGKTVVSAVLVEALHADYWKPIQAGNLDYTDSDFIKDYTLNGKMIHPEAYRFMEAVSPHLAAEYEDKSIKINIIKPVNINNHLIVEGAGGVMVPLSDNSLIKDLIKLLQLSVIVVSKNYLGSINHTLLTIEVIKQADIPIAGIIFNGESNRESENYILNYSGVTLLGNIPNADILSKGFIVQQAERLRKNILPLIQDVTPNPFSDPLSLDYESF